MTRNKGFGLIEVLIALAILAVGLLAVAVFQSSVVEDSNDNKARAEAIALAQQRLEEMRNYTGDVTDIDEFQDLYALTLGFANQTSIKGTNAQFSRQEQITQVADTRQISVMVSWVSAENETHEVQLQTELGFKSPSITGLLGMDLDDDPLVRSATGRAVLGAGQVKAGEIIDTDTNGDLTGLLDRGDGDLRLTNGDEAGDDVVLTLEDACELDDNNQRTGVPCTGFVEISGRVYIDTATQSSLKPGQVYIKASDAAYCQRYYTITDDEGNTTPIQIDESTTTTLLTQSGDYHYYDYTCYLGGGWHGNIGVMLATGITQRDKICQGDPTTLDEFADPRIAARRVYRGMAYATDKNGDPIEDLSKKIIYYSVGVSDALKLPVEGQASHDFVISDMSPGSNEGDLCITEGIMVRADSYIGDQPGMLFEGVPTDFFCLNTDAGYIDVTKMDTFGYSMDPYCPFDPSDPPSKRHELTFAANLYTTLPLSRFKPEANTSDGAGNCQLVDSSTILGGHRLTYSCDVYDWGNGWDGYIEFDDTASVFTCDRYRQTFTGVSADDQIDNFTCLATDYAVYGDVILTGDITGDIEIGSLDIMFKDTSAGTCYLSQDYSTYTCRTRSFDLISTWKGEVEIDSLTTKGDDKIKMCVAGMNGVVAAADKAEAQVSKGDTNLVFDALMSGSYTLNLHAIDERNDCPVS
ncbi:type IV pilus modification PilV family protein [Thalassotalea mangrovi]|uniref:Prepilin-type N-terminal cleavage/methylation domain-containing protein n=1 Tax=Thalassotalea mangrovi TaxID=2572245 RepID=A0A4U1B3V4_9GAMM|nr:prepilin-type N-terminal cleavage/methylation domain-containing protein [Thalassotalea mangrovi]TKB44260.1 prepilin-type N-terminal cleavage/methylation domain-containing protein [Thalassotalea mangrovi]